ncbi:MAG TPA: hypothetical protein DCK76_01740 [Desulfotomaculum sp.]|nr:MAG: hypothetical protein XD78_1900 [Desulfotomaculum sp. 46_296]HAG10123.1 hypothetical protein [Desulfotomaculum sp.]HBY03779.1 hypothetical protein [Desulfotomaculum sp.]
MFANLNADSRETVREIFDVKGARKYLRDLISEWLLRRELSNGNIPHFRIGNRILVDKAALDKWIENQSQPGAIRRVQ